MQLYPILFYPIVFNQILSDPIVCHLYYYHHIQPLPYFLTQFPLLTHFPTHPPSPHLQLYPILFYLIISNQILSDPIVCHLHNYHHIQPLPYFLTLFPLLPHFPTHPPSSHLQFYPILFYPIISNQILSDLIVSPLNYYHPLPLILSFLLIYLPIPNSPISSPLTLLLYLH